MEEFYISLKLNIFPLKDLEASCVCMCVYLSVCICLYACVCVSVCVYICIYLSVCVYVCVCQCACVYVSVIVCEILCVCVYDIKRCETHLSCDQLAVINTAIAVLDETK